MVRTLTWVLAGIILYTTLGLALRTRGLLPESVRLNGPLTTVHTQRGKVFLDRLARPRRFWRAYANFGVGITLVVMFGSLVLFLVSAYFSLKQPQPSALTKPENILAIPGVNQFLPLSMAPEIVAGMVLGLIVHEGGHGLMCRVEDIEIESMGLAFLTIVPLGAFVEPDEGSRAEASRGGQTRMFAAGVTNNFALALIALVLLIGPVSGAIAVADGVPVGGVYSGTPAATSGIGGGDVITSVGGVPVENESDLDARLDDVDRPAVEVGLKGGESVTVDREVIVVRSTQGAPVGVNTTITAVNGTAVRTETEFRDAVANRSVAVIETASGESVRTPIGASAVVGANSTLAGDAVDPEETIVVTAVDGRRIVTAADLQNRFEGVDPGTTVRVVGYVDGERRTFDVTVPEGGLEGLGLRTNDGTSGVVVTDFGIKPYPASLYLGILGGGGDGPSLLFAQRVYLLFVLPLAEPVGLLPYNFAGFSPTISSFYVTTGPLGVLGGGVFTLANLLFWTAWINIVLGQFNCIPALPLDGGHLLRSSVEAVVARLPVSRGRRLTTAITLGTSLLMIGVIVASIVIPEMLG
ncbi:metalloprotease [Halobacteriales archaeon QS_1_68_17]|nr:MAG: metalloprotease [Halobacteriales archaeon QS_1_68_17]